MTININTANAENANKVIINMITLLTQLIIDILIVLQQTLVQVLQLLILQVYEGWLELL